MVLRVVRNERSDGGQIPRPTGDEVASKTGLVRTRLSPASAVGRRELSNVTRIGPWLCNGFKDVEPIVKTSAPDDQRNQVS